MLVFTHGSVQWNKNGVIPIEPGISNCPPDSRIESFEPFPFQKEKTSQKAGLSFWSG